MTHTAQHPPSQRREYLVGCGLALAFVAIAAAIAAYGVGYLVRSGVRISKTELQAGLRVRLSGFESRGRVPAQDAAMFEEVVRLAGRDEATLYAVDLCNRLVQATLEDGVVSVDERRQVAAVRAALAGDPALGPEDVDALVRQHPLLAELYPGVAGSERGATAG